MEPTGAWVAGGSSAEFAIAPDPQSTLELFMRNGPVANRVTLESATLEGNTHARAWRRTRRCRLPTDRRRPVTPLNVTATNGFRPADVDPKSEDVRFLGVWIETR